MRGVPQHVTRRGKQAVVVLSEADFEALQRNAATKQPMGLIEHLLAIPKTPVPSKSKGRAEAEGAAEFPRLDLQPRAVDFS